MKELKLLIKDPKLPALRQRGGGFINTSKEYLYNFWVGDDVRNIAPPGWHMLTKTDLDALYLTVDPDGTQSSNDAGKKLKETGNVHWDVWNSAGTDEFGFTLLPCGYRESDGAFWNKRLGGYLWSNTEYEYSALSGYYTYASYGADILAYDYVYYKKRGYSIRFIKDDSTDPGTMTDNDGNVYPTVKIGSQVLMAVNFRGRKFRNGDLIPIVKYAEAWAGMTSAAMCEYGDGIIYTASVDPETLTWDEYNMDEKYFQVQTNLVQWYFGTGSTNEGFTVKVYQPDGETEIASGGYYYNNYVGVKPNDENLGGAERQFSIKIADWKNQTLATATGNQPTGRVPVAYAGLPQTKHATFSTIMAAVPSIGTGLWTLYSGMGTVIFADATSPTTGLTVSAYGSYTFIWTETSGGASNSDQMTITFYPV
jgi:uncharacterized protein (TIGR02145 family)